jgi:hypothetical protein
MEELRHLLEQSPATTLDDAGCALGGSR